MTTPYLDLSHLAILIDNNPDFIKQILECFQEDFGNMGERIEEQLQCGDYEQARILTHTLKGAAGNIGAKPLHEACVAFETELKRGVYAPALFKSLYDVLAETHNACCAQLQAVN